MNDAAEDALQRARAHLQRASLESLEAARALLEVAVQGSGLGQPSDDSLVAGLQRSLDEIVRGLRENAAFRLPAVFAEPLEAALEAEIARWEMRSRTDPDARPVLRAFLGLRELLWEIGLRRDPDATAGGASTGGAHSSDGTRPGRIRVQRFDVED